MTLTTQETERYTEMWGLSAYAQNSPGASYVSIFQEFATPPATVLDAGCGSGKGALALADAGFRVNAMCDLTDIGLVPEARARFPFVTACLWKPLRRQVRLGQVDWIFCADVMEHLPEQFTMLAVDHMLALAEHGVFLSLSTQPDGFGAWIGATLHQTVRPFTWWRDSLREVGRVVDARDLVGTATFVVTRAR